MSDPGTLFDLAGKVAIVTGAGRGIGRAMAEALAASGAKVVLAGRTLASLEETCASIEARGGSGLPKLADVAQESDVVALCEATLAHYGQIDVLVNNAGINPIWRTIEKISLADWQAIIDVNLTGVFLCCKHIGGTMAARGSGAIINVSSIAGHVGLARSIPYCASKGGLELMTRALALDWAERGVRVNALAPGYIDTDLTAGLLHNPKLSKPFFEHTPMGRFGTPRELAGAVIFLASDASSYMTGQSLVVDGGWTAH